MQSVIETAQQSSSLHFWLLTPGIEPADARPLEELVQSAGARLTLIDCSQAHADMQAARVDRHLSTAAYYRLFLPDLLPRDVERVIYLDCDVLFLVEVERLDAVDLGGCSLGAVINPRSESYRTLGLPGPNDYFNSGVLLLDLARLRETGEHRQAADFAQANPDKIPAHDQDALNYALAGKWHHLDVRWNQQYKFFRFNAAQLGFTEQELQRVRKAPFVAHFASKSKPWHYDNCHPFRERWFQTLDRTPFAGWRPSPRNLPDRARRVCLKVLPFALHPDHLRNEYRPHFHALKRRCRQLLSGSRGN